MGIRGKFVGLFAISLGCALDPKTVGMGDTDEGSGSASEASGTESDTDPSDTDDTDPSVSGSSGSDDGTCEDGANCVWEPCAELVCGAFCSLCAPWDTDCAEPGTFTVCGPEGTCEIWPEWDQDPCPGQGLQPGFESALSTTGGCADMTVYAANPDATIALQLRVDGLVAMVEESGEPVMVEYVADDPDLQLEVSFGSDLLEETCNDAVVVEPTVLEHWVAPAFDVPAPGTVTIAVMPDAGSGPRATVTLDGVWIRRDGPGDVFDVPMLIEHLEITDVSVGWLPG